MSRSSAAKAAIAARADIRLVAETALGSYYRIDTNPPVSVRHSANPATLVCLTHDTADSCEHTEAVQQYIASQNTNGVPNNG